MSQPSPYDQAEEQRRAAQRLADEVAEVLEVLGPDGHVPIGTARILALTEHDEHDGLDRLFVALSAADRIDWTGARRPVREQRFDLAHFLNEHPRNIPTRKARTA